MKAVLVTGGNGYIGSYLSDYLQAEGFNVFKTSRRPEQDNIRVMELSDTNSISGVCSGVDIVVHTATYDERMISGNEKEALLANSFATRQLYLDAVSSSASRFIYFSTFHVYGKSNGIVTEETETLPTGDYGLTHLFAEQYLKQLSQIHNLPVDIIRLTNGIGTPPPGRDTWYLILNDCCKSAVEKQTITLRSSGVQHRDFVAIKDVCSAVLCLLLNSPDGKFNVYNLSSQKSVSIRSIARMTADVYKSLTGSEVELEIPVSQHSEPEKEICVSSEKIRKLGWQQKYTIADVINEIIKSLL